MILCGLNIKCVCMWAVQLLPNLYFWSESTLRRVFLIKVVLVTIQIIFSTIKNELFDILWALPLWYLFESLFYLILVSNFQMTITFLIIKIERPGLCHFKALDLHFSGIITIFQEYVSNSRNSRNCTDPVGVYISSDLTWTRQINEVASKAISMAGWALRTFITRKELPMITIWNS